jgi:nucleotide sugar dehydrogenase
VIAVPTPADDDGSADLGFVNAAFNSLPPLLPAMIRSTVPPGTTDLLAAARNAPVAFVPEFLYEGGTGPWKESGDVPFMILGGTPEARTFFRPLLEKVFTGHVHECSAVVAELAKYTANLHWAARVTFVNELAGICQAVGADWEQVREAWLCDDRVNAAHTAMAGFPPGFGGKCWPKDLSALIAASSDRGYEPEFLHAIQEANARFQS